MYMKKFLCKFFAFHFSFEIKPLRAFSRLKNLICFFFKVFNFSVELCKNKWINKNPSVQFKIITNEKISTFRRNNFTMHMLWNVSGACLDFWIASRSSSISVPSSEFVSVSLDMFFTPNSWNQRLGFCLLFVFFLQTTSHSHCFVSDSLWVEKARKRMFNKV